MSKAHARLNRKRWERVRRAVFKRDRWRCVLCGLAGRLECDHITPLEREPGQDAYDLNGLQALCVNCHLKKTRKERGLADDPARAAWASLVKELTG